MNSTPSIDTTPNPSPTSISISPTKYSEYNNLPQSTDPQTSPTSSSNASKQSPKPFMANHQLSKRHSIPSLSTEPTSTQPTVPAVFYSSEKNSFAADDVNRPGEALPFRSAAAVATTTQDDNGSAKISVLVHNITLLSDDRQSTLSQQSNGNEQIR